MSGYIGASGIRFSNYIRTASQAIGNTVAGYLTGQYYFDSSGDLVMLTTSGNPVILANFVANFSNQFTPEITLPQVVALLVSLPSSPTGLSSGALWWNSGVLEQVF